MKSDFLSKRYIKRSFSDNRLDQSPVKPCLNGSGLPVPAFGSARYIYLRILHKFLCKVLFVDLNPSYLLQVFPSNTIDPIHYLSIRFIAFAFFMRLGREGYLFH